MSAPIFYKLVDREPVAVSGSMEWAQWMTENDPTVALDVLVDVDGGNCRVETTFRGIDIDIDPYLREPREPGVTPRLFATLVFGGALNGEIVRYETWDQALVGHARMVLRFRQDGQRSMSTRMGSRS